MIVRTGSAEQAVSAVVPVMPIIFRKFLRFTFGMTITTGIGLVKIIGNTNY
jgi:hypothetical protein